MEAMQLKETHPGQYSPVPTGEMRQQKTDLVMRAIGYHAVPVEGLTFDEKRQILQNDDGRLLDKNGNPLPGEYISGWARRGPKGIVGTNKIDAEQIVEHIIDDLPTLPVRNGEDSGRNITDLSALLSSKGVSYISKADWTKLAKAERHRGSMRHKYAEKFETMEEALTYLSKTG